MLIFKHYNLKYWGYSFLFFSLLFLIGKFIDGLMYSGFSIIMGKGIAKFLLLSYLVSVKWIFYWTVLSVVLYSYAGINKYHFASYKKLIVQEVPALFMFVVVLILLEHISNRYLINSWYSFLDSVPKPINNKLQVLSTLWIGISFLFLYIIGSSLEYSRPKIHIDLIQEWIFIFVFYPGVLFVKVWIVSYPNFSIPIIIVASLIMLLIALITTRKTFKTEKLDYYDYYWPYIDDRIYYFDSKYLLRTDFNGRSLLFVAVNRSDKDLIKFLLKKGLDINHKDHEGNTPLMDYVKKYPQKEIMELLIEKGADPFATDVNGKSLLSWIFETDKVDEAKYLINLGLNTNHTDNNGNTILHEISWGTSVEMVELLVKSGADINAKNQSGTTPLIKAVFAGNIEIIKVLIDLGADIDIRDKDGFSALRFAVLYCSPEIVELLISKGADVNAKDKKGRIPLDIVNCPSKGKLEEKVIKLLK